MATGIQITKLRLLISSRVLPKTPEGIILRKLLFKDFDAIVRNYGIENAIGLVKQHMPELSDKLEQANDDWYDPGGTRFLTGEKDGV